jgi:hypothetical protein
LEVFGGFFVLGSVDLDRGLETHKDTQPNFKKGVIRIEKKALFKFQSHPSLIPFEKKKLK